MLGMKGPIVAGRAHVGPEGANTKLGKASSKLVKAHVWSEGSIGTILERDLTDLEGLMSGLSGPQ